MPPQETKLTIGEVRVDLCICAGLAAMALTLRTIGENLASTLMINAMDDYTSAWIAMTQEQREMWWAQLEELLAEAAEAAKQYARDSAGESPDVGE